MKIDVTTVLVDLDGNPVKRGAEDFILRDACIEALMIMTEEDKNITGDEKLKRYELAIKCKKEDLTEMTVEEVALIKKLIGKAYAPLVVGQVWKILES